MVKLQTQLTALMRRQVIDRAKALGLEFDADDNIVEKSMKNVEGGPARILELADERGILTANAMAQLKRKVWFSGVNAARQAAISEEPTAEIRGLTLAMVGLSEAVSQATFESASLDNVGQWSDRVIQTASALQSREVDLGCVSPEVIEALVEQLGALSDHMTAYIDRTSKARSGSDDAEAIAKSFEISSSLMVAERKISVLSALDLSDESLFHIVATIGSAGARIRWDQTNRLAGEFREIAAQSDLPDYALSQAIGQAVRKKLKIDSEFDPQVPVGDQIDDVVLSGADQSDEISSDRYVRFFDEAIGLLRDAAEKHPEDPEAFLDALT